MSIFTHEAESAESKALQQAIQVCPCLYSRHQKFLGLWQAALENFRPMHQCPPCSLSH